jgi:predicted RNase H-like HicB family nuclease
MLYRRRIAKGKKSDTVKLLKTNIVFEVSKMTKQSFTVLIEKDDDGVFIGTVPSLKGCYSYGKTLDELMTNLKEAIEVYLEVLGTEEKRRRALRCFVWATQYPYYPLKQIT